VGEGQSRRGNAEVVGMRGFRSAQNATNTDGNVVRCLFAELGRPRPSPPGQVAHEVTAHSGNFSKTEVLLQLPALECQSVNDG